MNCRKLSLLFALVVLSLAPAHAESPAKKAAQEEADNEVVARSTCHNGKDERVLEVIPKEKGCVLQYTKDGKTEQKAKASHGVQVCQDTLGKIRARLEQAGFHCE